MRELWNELAAARERLALDSKRDLAMAWHVAALSRQPKLPALADLLKHTQSRRQTVGQQRVMLQMLSERLGIPLRRGKKGKKRP